MAKRPMPDISRSRLESLMRALEVEFVKLVECVVSPGWRLSLAATELPGIHYNLTGKGRIIIGEGLTLPLEPHTLAIIPPRKRSIIEADSKHGPGSLGTVESHWSGFAEGEIRRLEAGAGQPQIILICGYFRASYGSCIDLFASLPSPIVETFDAKDKLGDKLNAALAELVAQEIGSGAMSSTLVKQVLITILRRSLVSRERWREQFSALGDPQIARVFADMVTRPGACYSIQTLADAAGLSRSAFISRFLHAFGISPMSALRQLRMRHAAVLLETGRLSIDQIAQAAGYASRSGFVRAFRKSHGIDPSKSRTAAVSN
jgi:AraC family transcriptional regulator, activator of mtrCDE